MMPAVKHLDPILGVDIHLIITPPGPVVPIPHPHIGMVFDPFDYIPIIGSTVNVNGLPRAQAGTGGVELPPHFPIGGAFAKPPSNENETFMGSATVAVDGDAFTHMTLQVLSCQDIGMPSPPRKRGPAAKTLLLPTSIVLSIPAGPPVRVGGPPTISLMGLLSQLALGALLKGLKKLRRLQKASRKMKALSDRIHKAADKLMDKLKMGKRARDRVHKSICTLTGHPVDVVTGRVVTESVDWELPGPIPLKLERNYSSSLGWRDSVVGHGWSHSLDLAVWEEEGRVVYRAEDGREIEFSTSGFPRQQVPVGSELYEPIDRLTLRRVGETNWEVESAGGLTHTLRQVRKEGPCQVVRTHNRLGHAIVYEYDHHGRLGWVVDSAGRRLHFEYDRKGRLTKTWLPHPAQPGLLPYNRYAYSETGDLVEALDALGGKTRYVYESHLLTKETDRTGLSFYFEYEGAAQDAWCIHTWGDGGIYDHRLQYDKQGHITEVTNSLGHTTTYYSDGRGVVVRSVDPTGGEWQYAYDEALRRVAEAAPSGHIIRREYDSRGNFTKIALPDGACFTCQYNRFNLPQHATDALGGDWLWRYDNKGRLIEFVNALGERYAYEYATDLISAIICPLGMKTEFKYDEHRNLALVKLPTGATTRYQYDRQGRLTSLRDSHGYVQRRQYDAAGNCIRVDEPDGSIHAFSYDAERNLLSATGSTRQVRLAYTGLHQLALREEAGSRTYYRYDTEGQLLEIENELAERCLFVRDSRGLVIQECGFDGRMREYKRDISGKIVSVQKGDGATIALEYDPCGRVLKRSFSDGSTECFSYRLDGALIEAANTTTTVRFERDAVGRIVRELQGEHWVSTRYNPRGERITLESSQGAHADFLRSSIGAANSVIWARKHSSWRVDIERDLLGREIGRNLPGGVATRWERDPFGHPLSQSISHKGKILDRLHYEWADQHLKSIKSLTRGSTRYDHDARGRLSAAKHTDGRVEYRSPNALGSIHHRPDRDGRRYGAGGRIETLEGVRFAYDAEGNLVEKRHPDGRSWKYHYTATGMLSEVVRPDGARVNFEYDALHRRVRKAHSGEEVRWIWDGHSPLHEISKTGARTTWVFEPEGFALLGKIDSEERAYGAVCDHLGSATALYDETGQVVWKMQMDLLGRPHSDVAKVTSPWRWPGQYEDAETGLYYNRFRYYDPESGCYISPDPLGALAGTNSYHYTDDPATLIDPLGLNQVVPTDLFAVGNSTVPRPPRIEGVNLKPGQKPDLVPQHDGLLHPAIPPEGASTFADPSKSDIFDGSHHHKLPKGTVLPEGLGVIADGVDVGGKHGPTHHTIYPTKPMSPEEFLEKVKNLPWQPMGKYKKKCQ